MEVIEAMADIIRSLSGNLEPEKIAGILLNLCYDCEECGGTGIRPRGQRALMEGETQCHKCNGTGKLLGKDGKPVKMLVILSQNQSFEMDYDKAPFAFLSAVDADKLIEKQMFNTDADGFAFRRVFAGKTEGNNATER